MARVSDARGGILFHRKIYKLTGGAKVDWNDREVRVKIYKTISMMNRLAARKVERKAKRIVAKEAYDTGALYRSIKAVPLESQLARLFGRERRPVYAWNIVAGDNDKIDYAGHVELGRYYKETERRVAAVPFMRKATVYARKWLRPRMKVALKRALT
jgi:hypothetical protein